MAGGAESIWEANGAFTLGLLAACRSARLPEVNLPSSPNARLSAASQNTAAGAGLFSCRTPKQLHVSGASDRLVQRDIASAGVCAKPVGGGGVLLPCVSVRFLCISSPPSKVSRGPNLCHSPSHSRSPQQLQLSRSCWC